MCLHPSSKFYSGFSRFFLLFKKPLKQVLFQFQPFFLLKENPVASFIPVSAVFFSTFQKNPVASFIQVSAGFFTFQKSQLNQCFAVY